jgi:hypothetical protein
LRLRIDCFVELAEWVGRESEEFNVLEEGDMVAGIAFGIR